jgi:hypothetical protein
LPLLLKLHRFDVSHGFTNRLEERCFLLFSGQQVSSPDFIFSSIPFSGFFLYLQRLAKTTLIDALKMYSLTCSSLSDRCNPHCGEGRENQNLIQLLINNCEDGARLLNSALSSNAECALEEIDNKIDGIAQVMGT